MRCKTIVMSVAIFIVLSVVSAEHCVSTDILCYSAEKYNSFKIYITINNTLTDNETSTLSYVKDLLQEIPSVKCLVQGCNEEFNNRFQSELESNAKVHIYEKERNLASEAPKVTPVFQYRDMVTLDNDDAAMEREKNSSTFFDEIDSDIEETKNIINRVNNYIDVNDSDDDAEWSVEDNGKQRDIVAQNIPGYPIQFTLFPGNASSYQNIRVKRASKACDLGNLENSYVKCEVWPDLYLCKQKCTFGHGLETSRGTVVKRSHKCRISRNRWEPEKIEDCKPYMNCKVTLKEDQAGFLHCQQRDHFEAPYCNIKCGSKKPQRHECSKEMANDLPECVTLSDDVMTIDRPMSGK